MCNSSVTSESPIVDIGCSESLTGYGLSFLLSGSQHDDAVSLIPSFPDSISVDTMED
ncbi:MAG: hypothetical protein MHPSP_002087, partial [Paramarteilia canceri]